MSRVTYILGAGASYGERKKDKDGNVIGFTRGLPIVNELETALQFLRDGEPTTSVRFPVEEAKKWGVSLEDYKKFVEELKENSSIFYADVPLKDDLHPTMKPIELIKKQIKNSSKEGDSILDLFGGSGTTLLACEELNRKCFMMEYDPKYADVIIERWEQASGKVAQKINNINVQ